MKRKILLAGLIFSTMAMGQDEPKQKHPYDIARDEIKNTVEQVKKDFANDPDILVLDSLVADRKKKKVDIYGCFTTIAATDAVEFFIAPFDSGKDYESLTITWAKPSDVHKALEFIGLKPGRPINFDTNHHWSRGPRIVMKMSYGKKIVRAEDMVLDTETAKPLPHTGMIFSGSFIHTAEEGKKHYAADMVDSKALAPNYNDPVAVMDMPRRMSQSEVYGFQKPNPDQMAKAGTLVTVSLEPGADADLVVSTDLKISMTLQEGKPAYSLQNGAQAAAPIGNAAQLVETLSKLVDGRTDLFTTVQVSPDVPVNDLRKFYALLMTLEKDRGIKIDPPAEGELFHRGFFPQETWRKRDDRLGEPWELFLTRENGNIVARLERQVEVFEGGRRMEVQKYPVKAPADLVKVINENQSQWSKAVFVFPPADLTYGELMTWAKPAMATYPRIFVFTPDAPATQPTTGQAR